MRRQTLSDQVAEQLRNLALSGVFPVGGALPSEAELSRIFQCSRSAIREDLRSLEQMGILRRADIGKELLVASIPPEKPRRPARQRTEAEPMRPLAGEPERSEA